MPLTRAAVAAAAAAAAAHVPVAAEVPRFVVPQAAGQFAARREMSRCADLRM
jgi:hypothetical protein